MTHKCPRPACLALRIRWDFMVRALTTNGLARKYRMTREQVENVLRGGLRK